ncbi:calpain 7 [Entophlyctis sp. JEL0112]|nr:calpain 7 [Entophlyctis sp. JEL0112]
MKDVVTDCSFVASLCVSAAFERRFQKQLITSCIFPQDANGVPLFNPVGKYIVKLFFNGIYRKVVVDDYLPVSRRNKLMCTYSNNENEVWPSIIEKAYMKLNGGYDFPGSNSGIDLYALTGWIPEQLFVNEANWNADFQWKRILNGFSSGNALITLATIDMSNQVSEGIGLVPTHAYAVLNIREVLGLRMIQHNGNVHAAGKFSHLDHVNWTPELKEALNFDRLGAMQHDDGIFWMDFSSVMQFFESIHVNWNPSLFRYQHVMHVSWPLETGPAVDVFSLAHNPQYGLEVDLTDAQSQHDHTVWLLLSKHVTMKEENKDYITLHIYADTNCNRVYYPEMYKVIYVGMYVNNPHILASFRADSLEWKEGEPKRRRYTVVLSQHEKTRSLSFSLRAYAKESFKFGAIGKEYPHECIVSAFIVEVFILTMHVKSRHNLSELSPSYTLKKKFTIYDGFDSKFFLMAEMEDDDAESPASLTIEIVDEATGEVLLDSGPPRQKFSFVETIIECMAYTANVHVHGAAMNAGEKMLRLTFRSELRFDLL